MDFKKVREVEEWANFRENTPKYTKFTPKSYFRGFLLMAVVPIVLYKCVVGQGNYQNRVQNFKEFDYEEDIGQLLPDYTKGATPTPILYTANRYPPKEE